MPTSDTLAALRQAAEGLTYQSETDAPWKAFSWPGAAGDPTGEGVRRRGRHRADAPAEEQSPDDFFAPLTWEQDWYGDVERAQAQKYRALLDVVRRTLRGVKVFRVGRRKVRIYVVGVAPEGGWAGLATTAVET
jgi:hypothetical protein